MFHSYQFMIVTCICKWKKSKIHAVTHNRYKLKKQSWHRKSVSLFFKSWDKRMLFFFHNQISFSFSNFLFLYMFNGHAYSCTCLICKVFADVFLITRIPHSKVLIHFRQREKAILWTSWLLGWPPGSVL